jgi:hypothetical protein
MFLYDAKTELSFVRIAMTGALLSGRSDMGGQIFISFFNFIPPFFFSVQAVVRVEMGQTSAYLAV